MFILSAYVRSDKHSLTFHHYSGMSALYPKPRPSSLPLESEPTCPCLIAKVCFSWAETARVMSTRACHCHLYTINCDVTATMLDSARLNRRVSRSTLLQPSPTTHGPECHAKILTCEHFDQHCICSDWRCLIRLQGYDPVRGAHAKIKSNITTRAPSPHQ
jgi:hypothetical protein